jgi:hypothetical protein
MKRLICSLVFMLLIFNLMAQSVESRNKIEYGVGVSSYMSKTVEGSGLILYIGYQHKLSERFSLNPYLTTGGFGANAITDHRDTWFTSTNIGCDVWLKPIDERVFSFSIAGGLLANRMKGLLGTGGEETTVVGSEYVREWQPGFHLGSSFLFKNVWKRCEIELRPINLNFGRKQYLDIYSMVVVSLKL